MGTHHMRLATVVLSALSAPLALAQTVTPPPVPLSPPVTLRYRFTPGQTQNYQFTMDMNGSIPSPATGQRVPLTQHMEAVMHQTVQSVRASDGAATITSSLDDVTMTMNGQPLPMSDAQKAAMKQAPTVVMSPSGRVLSVVGQSTAGGGMVPGLGNLGIFQNGGSLPEHPVRVGETWHSTTGVAGAGVQAASTYTLKGLSTTNGVQNADIAMTFEGSIHPSATAGASLPVAITGKVSGTGREQFDVTNGALTRVEATTTVVMSLPKTPAPGAAAAQPMQIQMQVKTTLSRLKTPAVARAPRGVTPLDVRPSAPSGSYINDAGF